MTMEELIAKYEIGFECKPVALSPRLFRCRITRGSRGVNVAYQGEQPTLAAVLARLAGGALGHETTKQPNPRPWKRGARRDEGSFKAWCAKYNLDPDSRQTWERYLIVRRKSEALKYTLGEEAYKLLLEAEP